MDQVLIFDTTLRDGEQSPGISLSPDEKLQIANALAALGVDIIEAGFPIASEGDFLAVQTIARQVHGPVICALARAESGDINRAFEAIRDSERPRIHTFIATSDLHIKEKLRSTRKDVLGQIRASVSQARELCDDVEFSPEDGSRSERQFLAEAVALAIDAGATTINIPDTVGYATPQSYSELLENLYRDVPELTDVVLSTHCHDDLGLAVANSLAGIEVGARQVECAINGLGERAGNASLEEIVMLLRTHPGLGFDSDIQSQQLTRVSKLVSRLTGYPVPANKAIVGRNAFAHESGIHQSGVLRDKRTYEIMNAEDVGQVSNALFLGKHSGRGALKAAFEEMGYNLSGGQLNQVFAAFKELADRKKEISSADLEALVVEKGEVELELVDYQLHSELLKKQTGEVTISDNGRKVRGRGRGDGPIDALFNAVVKALKVESELVDYRVSAASSDSDALAEAVVVIEDGGRQVTGRAADTDTIAASIKAWLDGLSRLRQ